MPITDRQKVSGYESVQVVRFTEKRETQDKLGGSSLDALDASYEFNGLRGLNLGGVT